MKNIFCMMDCETTGLGWWHEIIEIGMILFDQKFQPCAKLVLPVNAEHNPETFSKEAFEVNGFDPLKVSSHGVPRQAAGVLIREWLAIHAVNYARVIPAGHNIIKFDIPKIRQFLLPDFDNYFSDRRIIDTKRIADFFNIRDEFESTSLQELAKYFSIPVNKAHSALDDCCTNLEVLKHFYAGRIG